MSTGALIFAHNNPGVDYIKLAVFSAQRVKKHLNIPVSLVTDDVAWLTKMYPDHPFDKIIKTGVGPATQKIFYDGSLSSKKLEWKNVTRNQAYDLTPYDKTLVLDSDYIISSDILKIALSKDEIFQIYKNSFDIAGWRDTKSFQRINAYSIPFYWATVFVFEKNAITQSFFDLVSYIKNNWLYFRVLYSIETVTFRNDFAFSIAIHIMNGKTNGEFAVELPGTMTYIQDRDVLLNIVNDKMNFLVEKKDHLGEYIAAKTNGIDVHVMNKSSLIRVIDREQHV
jgi:hypothetical protein